MSTTTDATTTDATTRMNNLELDLPGTVIDTDTSNPVLIDGKVSERIVVQNNVVADQDWSGKIVNEGAKSLALDEKAVAERHGFNVDRSQLFYDEGTKLMDSGDDKLDREAVTYDGLDTLFLASANHHATIAAEQRKTSEVELAGWRLDIDGKLREVKDGKFGPLHIDVADHAINQMRPYVKKGYAAGPNPNTWMGNIEGKQRLRARTRADGVREAFAVLGPASTRGYVEFDTDRVLAEAAKQLAGMNLKASVRYSEGSTRMSAKIIAQAPVDIAAFRGVGRVHQIGVMLTAADNGSVSISAEAFLIRIRCLNATLVKAKGGTKARVRHVGNVERMGEALKGALDDAAAAIPEMQDLWQKAAIEHYVDAASGTQLGMKDAFQRLIELGHLPRGGLGLDGAISAYMSAWRAEDSPTSAMGVIMAVQRAAHETSWRSVYAEDEVNEAASDLLYQPVYTLSAAA